MNHPSTVWKFGPLTIKLKRPVSCALKFTKKVEFEEVTTLEPKGKMW